ncbi:MAG: OsmC family protein [Clostridiales bacterium]|nr:OsmC family protein [Clostridiales bacterium]
MAEIQVALRFGQAFQGALQAGERRIAIGKEAGGFSPYELLLGALGSCYYATFVDIAKKMRLAYQGAEITVRGTKRAQAPTTLETAAIALTIRGAESQKGFERASQLAARHCSVHHTLEKVAQITLTLRFEEGESPA